MVKLTCQYEACDAGSTVELDEDLATVDLTSDVLFLRCSDCGMPVVPDNPMDGDTASDYMMGLLLRLGAGSDIENASGVQEFLTSDDRYDESLLSA